MKVSLVGVQDMDFKGKDGSVINGVKVFIAYPDSNTYGNVAESKFIQRKIYESFKLPVEKLIEKIGEVVNVEFDPKKKIVGITL
ncbi:MAG: hypothetical protein EGR86_04455 [Ruminiclostridium sp.]|nr:hypothetical protein [Ruminiclostridium sp.]